MIFHSGKTQIYKLSLFLCFIIASSGCQRNAEERVLDEGKALSQKHCTSCHLLPDPALLDKLTWENGVLPAMAEQLGIEVLEGNMYLHHSTSAISSADWSKLTNYYKTLAPESLPANSAKMPLTGDSSLFTVLKPNGDTTTTSSTTLVAIDSLNQQIFVGDSYESTLMKFGRNMGKSLTIKVPSPATDIHFTNMVEYPYLVTCMGGMQAVDATRGQVIAFSNGKVSAQKLLSNDLIRPIETRSMDFNKDGLRDYLICAFGHNRGGLYLLVQNRNKSFKQVAIRATPGVTNTVIRDFNHDGWPDIMALFAHGNEGIWLFLNDQKGGFKEKNLLRFPSVYGSSSFQLVDMNRDGKADIVYTAGDNSDYSRILKPYHGLYIFTDTGELDFKQTFFYPINGCTKAVARDFDGDGAVDIATIAFFADLKNKPEETFIYFKNTSGSATRFTPQSIPIHQLGRWICMDVNDFDGDGDADIVLGNYSRGFLNQEKVKPEWNIHLPFIVLQNNTISSKKRH